METLTLTRILAAPPADVWQALTDPAALTAWFWPARMSPRADADPRPGGTYRIAAAQPEMAVHGEYVEVEPARRLVCTWQWDGDAESTYVTLELAPRAAGTELTVTHERFPDAATRDVHVQGWQDCLDRLPGWLSR